MANVLVERTLKPSRNPTWGAQEGFPLVHPGLRNWGWLCVILYLLLFIFPSDLRAYYRLVPPSVSTLWIIALLSSTPVRLRLCFPIVCALILQLWSLVPALHANLVLARGVELGSWHFYLIEWAFPYAVAYLICRLDPRAYALIPRLIYAFCMVSAVIGLLQFLGVPPFPQLASIYAGQLAQFHGDRIHGLNAHPGFLAAQCIIGTILVGSRALHRRLNLWEYLSLGILAMAVFVTQARFSIAVYILIFLVVMGLTIRRSPIQGMLLLLIVSSTVVTVIRQNPERFEYALGIFTGEFDTLTYRQQRRWSIGFSAIDRQPVFGIGPDSGLFGGGFRMGDKWAPRTLVVENAYLLVGSMYGIPGLIIFCIGIFGSFGICLFLLVGPNRGPVERRSGLVGTLLLLLLMLIFTIGNTINDIQTFTAYLLIMGWIVAGVRMERAGIPVQTDIFPEPTTSEIGAHRRLVRLQGPT